MGITAKDYPHLKGNIRDYSTLEQLVVLSNLENIHALLIRQGLMQSKHHTYLNKTAIRQMKSLLENITIKINQMSIINYQLIK